MSSRIRIFDKAGLQIAEVDANCSRAWKLNEAGSAEFTLANNDAKAKREIVEFGNYLVIDHDKLPTWAGIIDPPRPWGYKKFTVKARGAEYILHYRATPITMLVEETPGNIFAELLVEANKTADTYIREGVLYVEGALRKETYNAALIYEKIVELSKNFKMDWDVLPIVDANGRLTFTANWYKAKGMIRDLVLQEGHNIELSENPLTEQGEIINDLFGFGNGASWESKPTANAQNTASIAQYGHRQGVQQFNTNYPEKVPVLTENAVSISGQPRRTFNPTALDKGDTFYNLELGDTLPIEFFSVGFNDNGGFGTSANVRIMAMSYSDTTNRVDIACDEVIENGQ